MSKMKRMLSLLLALALLIGNIPAVVFAAETSAVSGDAETVRLEGDSSCYVNNYAYMELFGTTASEVTWTLSDPNVAMIYYSDATCLYLYGLSSGTVTVTATTESGLTASFEVTIMGTPASGTCGDNLTWNLDDEGTLTISGTGEMTSRPWRTSFSRQIKNIVIENGVTSIYWGAFWGCRNITELAIPASVTSIGEEAFLSCYNLQSFSVDPANTAFCASEGVLFNADMTKLIAYPAGKTGNYTIPKTVKTIGYKAFDGAKIEQLTIPASVTTLENYAFNGTIGFCVDADNSVFASGSAGELYSKDKTVLYRYCTKQVGETYTVADGVVTIADGAFEDGISKVVFPDSVQTIGGWAFNGSVMLESVTFGTGLKEIGDCAFQTCTGLKTIYFTGDAPTFVDIPFNDHVIATAYYPAGNPTWTSDVMQNYGYDSTITWVPYGEPQVLEAPVVTITANESTGKPIVKWNTVEGAVKYRVYRSTKKTSGYELVYTGIKARSYTDKTAKAGTNYYYKVKAIHEDSSLNSGWSNIVNRMCDLAQPEVGITGSSTSGKPIVKWETVTGAAKYRVYRATSENGKYELVYTGISARSYTDKTAKAGTTYYYKVKAIHSKSSADSAYSEIISRVCDLAKPEVTIKLKNGDPRLTWEKVDGAAKYYIYRATSKDGKYTKIKTTVSATSFTDTTAKAGTKYYYKVKAIHKNTDANSAYSSIKYITAK